jgi:hypothetical protein
VEVKLSGNDSEGRRRFEFLLIVGHKERDAEESVIKFVECLALIWLGKHPVVEVRDHQGLAGLEVGAHIIEYASLRVRRRRRQLDSTHQVNQK